MKIAYLASTVRRRRLESNLTMAELERITGLSASTISRLENLEESTKLTTPCMMRLTQWLGVPFERFLGLDDYMFFYPHENGAEILSAIIWADLNLDDEAKEALSSMMITAYNALKV